MKTAQIPLVFERQENRFLARTGESSIVLDPQSVTFAGPRGSAVRMTLEGGNPAGALDAEQPQASVSNYYVGRDPRNWRTGIPHFGQVRYRHAYPGIDLVFHGNQQQLEYDFVLAPKADPRRITLAFSGADSIRVDPQGNLLLQTPQGMLRQHAPVIYQDIDGQRRSVQGRYFLKGTRKVGFRLSRYDRRHTLVIDPILSYSTYFGGTGFEILYGFATDPSGNTYLGGATTSADLPATPGTSKWIANGGNHGFVVKIDPTGTRILYMTYLSGSGYDTVWAVNFDTAGNTYATGYTTSNDFPVTAGAYKTTSKANYSTRDGFAVKLSTSGQLLYSTYLVGTGLATPEPHALAVDGSGRAYIAGTTNGGINYPTSPGAYQTQGKGLTDGFVTVLNPAGSGIVYSTLLGASSNVDVINGIALTSTGNAVVVGYTNPGNVSSSQDFPVTAGSVQTTPGGGIEGFVAEFNATGTALVFSTVLGGSGSDQVNAVALDANGNIYVTGTTTSINFPTVNIPANSPQGTAFVSKLDPTGKTLLYSTYFGTTYNACKPALPSVDPCTSATSIALDSQGGAYLTGSTTDATLTNAYPGAIQPMLFPPLLTLPTAQGGNGSEAFLAHLNSLGAVDYTTYLGGTGGEAGVGVGVDAAGNVYLGGNTNSLDFPTSSTAIQTTNKGANSGSYNYPKAFAAKISMQPGNCSVSVSPATISIAASSTPVTGSFSVEPGTGCVWVASLAESDSSAWLTLISPAGGVGPGTVTYSAAPNVTSGTRTTTLMVNKAVVSFVQAGLNCSYSLSSNSGTISGSGGSGTVTLTTGANCPWTASPNTPLLTIDKSSGIGSATITYSMPSNEVDQGMRSAYILIQGIIFPITQLSGCSYAVSPTSFVLPAAGGPISISITATPSTCKWVGFTFMGSGWTPPFVIGTGTQTLTYTVPPNTGPLTTAIWKLAEVPITFTQAASPTVSPLLVTKIGVVRPSGTGLLWLRDRDGDGLFGTAADTFIPSGTLGAAGDQPLIGDWSGSGTKKLGVYRPQTIAKPGAGLFVLDVNGDEQYTSADRALFVAPQAGDVAIVGRWDGGTKDQLGIFRNGVFYLDSNGDGSFVKGIVLGQPGDIPVVGDWNGDGRSKVGVFRAGLWILDYNGDGVWNGIGLDRAFFLGAAGDQPVVGDWNGDRRSKVGVFRANAGLWVLDYDGNGHWDGLTVDRALYNIGGSTALAVVGDWTGDGKTKAGVFRDGNWYLDTTGDGSFIRLAFLGQAGDTPIVGKW